MMLVNRRRFVNVYFPNTLKTLCIQYVGKNIDRFKGCEDLQHLPYHLKERIIVYVTRVLKGFQNDDIFEALLHDSLEYIDLSNMTISDRTLTSLMRCCPNLKEIVVTEGRHTFSKEVLFATMPSFSGLYGFQLHNCDEVDDEFIHELTTKCRDLELLDLTGCKNITDNCASYLENLKIKQLNISRTQITDEFLAKLNELSIMDHIVDLNLSRCNITSAGLKYLRWDRLKYVGFDGCFIDDLDFIGNNNKQLKFLQWSISSK